MASIIKDPLSIVNQCYSNSGKPAADNSFGIEQAFSSLLSDPAVLAQARTYAACNSSLSTFVP